MGICSAKAVPNTWGVYRTNALLACKITRTHVFLQTTCRFCKLMGHLFCKKPTEHVGFLQNKCPVSLQHLHFCYICWVKNWNVLGFCKLIGHLLCKRSVCSARLLQNKCPISLQNLHLICNKHSRNDAEKTESRCVLCAYFFWNFLTIPGPKTTQTLWKNKARDFEAKCVWWNLCSCDSLCDHSIDQLCTYM